jgi:hypothetical protein
MKQLALVLLGAVLGMACSASPTVIPTKNMDRPTDMAFVCLGLVSSENDGTTKLGGLPMSSCHRRTESDPAIASNGQRVLGTFAFIPNATRGELAVADMDRGRLLDLGPAAPGYSMLPIGGDPEVISASRDGCWVVTANRTTCDLTLVDPSRLLADTFSLNGAHMTPASAEGDVARQIQVRTRTHILRTTPGEIAFLPPTEAPGSCSAPRAVATFPSCNLVAVLDLSFDSSSATIRSAYYIRPDLPGGFQSAGSDPICPTDCGGAEPPDDATENMDAGAVSDGGTVVDATSPPAEGGWRLQPLALTPDGDRVYVGSLYDTAITSLNIGQDGLLANPARIPLADDPTGVSRIRLAVDPFAGDDGFGRFLEIRGRRFLYAFTADDSVRVVDITGSPVECDVNLWPSSLPAATPEVPNPVACVPVGTPNVVRRALAQGPGLRITTFSNPDSPAPLPRDIAFAELDMQRIDTNSNYHSLSGQFGFLLASNGQVYVVNLAPSGDDKTPTHSFREVRDVGKSLRTPLAISIAPQRSVVVADQAFATTANLGAEEGPLIKPFSRDKSSPTSWFGFPDSLILNDPSNAYSVSYDSAGIVSRSWDVVWEGVLPQTARESGMVMSATDGIATAGWMGDAGADFCRSGVQPGDVLLFTGCTQDSDCQPDDMFSCQVTVSGARGACLPRDRTTNQQIAQSCARFLGSRMRYQIVRAEPAKLALSLKLDEVPKTTLNPCRTDDDCRPTADYSAFQCLELQPQDRRCVRRCDYDGKGDADCRAGNVCELVAGVPTSVDGDGHRQGLCVEAPPLDPTCFPTPLMARYNVRAGNSFMVFGSSLPRLRTSRKSSTTGSCEVDQTANRELVARIPLHAPRCPDAFLAKATGTEFVQDLSVFSPEAGSNPCLFTGSAQDGDSTSSPDTQVRAYFENPQIRFVIANLDQYAGDLLSIHFEFQYGFVPLTVQIPTYEVQLTMATRIITGPTITPESPVRGNPDNGVTFPYIYVVDQGRAALTPASRGQVLRINPRAGTNHIVTFDTAISGSTPFQVL